MIQRFVDTFMVIACLTLCVIGMYAMLLKIITILSGGTL